MVCAISLSSTMDSCNVFTRNESSTCNLSEKVYRASVIFDSLTMTFNYSWYFRGN